MIEPTKIIEEAQPIEMTAIRMLKDKNSFKGEK